MAERAGRHVRDTVHPVERRLVEQAGRDVRRVGRERARVRLQREARRSWGAEAPGTWVDAVLDEAEWGQRYELGPPYDAVVDAPLPVVDHGQRAVPRSTPARPTGPDPQPRLGPTPDDSPSTLLRWAAWALVAVVAIRAWRSALNR